MRFAAYFAVLFALSTLAAYAISPGQRHILFHPLGGNGSAPTTGKILLVDNASHLLQTDNLSKVCLAGGC